MRLHEIALIAEQSQQEQRDPEPKKEPERQPIPKEDADSVVKRGLG